MIKDHLGNHFESESSMVRHYNIPRQTFRSRIDKGWSLEKALTFGKKSHTVHDHLGNKFSSISSMVKHYGISYQAFLSRRAKGMSLKDALTTPLAKYTKSQNIKDHLGKHYNSYKELAEAYDLDEKTLKVRLYRGWSLEDSLLCSTHKHSEYSKEVSVSIEDHLGNTYPSYSSMAKAYGISFNALYHRLNSGWSVKDALTTPVRAKKKGTLYRKRRD